MDRILPLRNGGLPSSAALATRQNSPDAALKVQEAGVIVRE